VTSGPAGFGQNRAVSPPPARRASPDATDRVRAALRDAVMRGVLAPGEHLRQEDWAARLTVSRFQIRDALRYLTAEGLLTHDPHRGYFVAAMDVDEMSQLYLMRRLLEAEILRTVRAPDAEELAQLRAASRQVEQAMEALDAQRTVLQERRFYFQLYDLSPLRTVAQEARRLWSLSEVYRASFFFGALPSQEFRAYVTARHRQIIDTVARADGDRLAELVLEGRLTMESRLASYLQDRQAFFEGWQSAP
jgi:DNA-binding GntR family transcriptional regulator